MAARRISDAVIRRLPRYYRHLSMLYRQGAERISSAKLAENMCVNASQVRQDFNCFGGFGQQGYGYHVPTLLKEIETILDIDHSHKVIIVGAGNIGQALANFEGFENIGFFICALFDINEALIGTAVNGIPILHVEQMCDYIRENGIAIGAITARRSVAQQIANQMVESGIQGIWNFAPVDVVAKVPVENVHLNDSIFVLSYRIRHELGNEKG